MAHIKPLEIKNNSGDDSDDPQMPSNHKYLDGDYQDPQDPSKHVFTVLLPDMRGKHSQEVLNANSNLLGQLFKDATFHIGQSYPDIKHRLQHRDQFLPDRLLSKFVNIHFQGKMIAMECQLPRRIPLKATLIGSLKTQTSEFPYDVSPWLLDKAKTMAMQALQACDLHRSQESLDSILIVYMTKDDHTDVQSIADLTHASLVVRYDGFTLFMATETEGFSHAMKRQLHVKTAQAENGAPSLKALSVDRYFQEMDCIEVSRHPDGNKRGVFFERHVEGTISGTRIGLHSLHVTRSLVEKTLAVAADRVVDWTTTRSPPTGFTLTELQPAVGIARGASRAFISFLFRYNFSQHKWFKELLMAEFGNPLAGSKELSVILIQISYNRIDFVVPTRKSVKRSRHEDARSLAEVFKNHQAKYITKQVGNLNPEATRYQRHDFVTADSIWSDADEGNENTKALVFLPELLCKTLSQHGAKRTQMWYEKDIPHIDKIFGQCPRFG